MTKPRIALVIGIICISIFPVLVKLSLTPGLISAFYRMAIAGALILPYAIINKKLFIPNKKLLILSIVCGVLFGADVAVWNIAIQQSTATQASLLTNLSPIWVGISSFLFLPNKPSKNFWIGTAVSLIGMFILVGIDLVASFNFDLAFIFGILSGVFYSIYLLISKKVLSEISVIPFLTTSILSSAIFLGGLSYLTNEPFYGFSNAGWFVLAVQGVVCQLLAWVMVSYATKHMRATRVSLSLLSQALLASLLAWIFLDETISFEMIIGGIILLFGIRITFYPKDISFKKLKRKFKNDNGDLKNNQFV